MGNRLPQIIRNYHGQIETLRETHAVKIAEIKRSVSCEEFTNIHVIIHAVIVLTFSDCIKETSVIIIYCTC